LNAQHVATEKSERPVVQSGCVALIRVLAYGSNAEYANGKPNSSMCQSNKSPR